MIKLTKAMRLDHETATHLKIASSMHQPTVEMKLWCDLLSFEGRKVQRIELHVTGDEYRSLVYKPVPKKAWDFKLYHQIQHAMYEWIEKNHYPGIVILGDNKLDQVITLMEENNAEER